MQAIDYSKLLDSAVLRDVVPQEAAQAEGLYQRDEGVQFRLKGQEHQVFQEVVRLADGAFLFASENPAEEAQPYQQVISDSDWVHIQFRLKGGGHECISQLGVIQTPEKSCIVARYPKDSVVERTVDKTNGWKAACLFVNPRALPNLLDVSASKLPECVLWMALDKPLELRTSILPLRSSMILAVNDILLCTFRGCARRAYMRAKSLELLSTVIHVLDSGASEAGPTVKLSTADFRKIFLAHSIMTADLESTLTLAELAHRVGLNRTKLALGFKGVYGISVQAYWRDAKLDRARELLRDGQTSVTEVALSLGYSELSSFTRAFTRKFGVLPRECRTSGGRVLGRD